MPLPTHATRNIGSLFSAKKNGRGVRAPRPFFLNFLYILYFVNLIYFFGLDSGGTNPLFR
jgi:hypothetical protein